MRLNRLESAQQCAGNCDWAAGFEKQVAIEKKLKGKILKYKDQSDRDDKRFSRGVSFRSNNGDGGTENDPCDPNKPDHEKCKLPVGEIATVEAEPAPDPPKEKSDCAVFTDELVELATAHMKRGRVEIGRELLARVFVNAAKPPLNHVFNPTYATAGFTGFKDKHVRGGAQGGWAMAHIQGVAGASLVWEELIAPDKVTEFFIGNKTGKELYYAQFAEDEGQLAKAKEELANAYEPREHNAFAKLVAEKEAELENDFAGASVAVEIIHYINGSQSKVWTTQTIFKMLCDN